MNDESIFDNSHASNLKLKKKKNLQQIKVNIRLGKDRMFLMVTEMTQTKQVNVLQFPDTAESAEKRQKKDPF